MPAKSNQTAIARRNLERRLAPLREEALARPPRGWIKAIREALGMSTAQLGARMSRSQSWISQIEAGEVGSALTMQTLQQVAEAMDCRFIYAIVPNAPLDDLLRARAQALVDELLARTNQTMRLENQALTKSDLAAERERLVADLLRDPRRLWARA